MLYSSRWDRGDKSTALHRHQYYKWGNQTININKTLTKAMLASFTKQVLRVL